MYARSRLSERAPSDEGSQEIGGSSLAVMTEVSRPGAKPRRSRPRRSAKTDECGAFEGPTLSPVSGFPRIIGPARYIGRRD